MSAVAARRRMDAGAGGEGDCGTPFRARLQNGGGIDPILATEHVEIPYLLLNQIGRKCCHRILFRRQRHALAHASFPTVPHAGRRAGLTGPRWRLEPGAGPQAARHPGGVAALDGPWPGPVHARPTGGWHDFGGFPPELYTLQYAAPGSPELAARAQALLADAGIAPIVIRAVRWTMAPGAAALPLSRGRRAGGAVVAGHGARRRRPARTGALALRDEDVLIIGSGSLTHNLRDVRMPDAPPASYVPAFQQWYAGRLADHDRRRCWTGRRGRRARRRPIRMTIT